MSKENQTSRKKFLQQIGSFGLLAAAGPLAGLAAKEKADQRILRYTAPCLACNDSYFQKKIIYWDPVNMKLLKG